MKKISFKAIGIIVSLLCVIGGVSAAYQKQVLHRLSPRNSETVTTENGQSARLSNFKLNQEDFGEYSVLSATSNSVSSSSYAEVGSGSSAAGETPALIYGYAQMGDYCPEGAPCMISFQSGRRCRC